MAAPECRLERRAGACGASAAPFMVAKPREQRRAAVGVAGDAHHFRTSTPRAIRQSWIFFLILDRSLLGQICRVGTRHLGHSAAALANRPLVRAKLWVDGRKRSERCPHAPTWQQMDPSTGGDRERGQLRAGPSSCQARRAAAHRTQSVEAPRLSLQATSGAVMARLTTSGALQFVSACARRSIR
jgi:hypothetical protein